MKRQPFAKSIRRKHISFSMKEAIMNEQQGLCLLCGQALLGQYEDGVICAPQVDHLMPWSYSYDNEFENLCVLCDRCNHIKSNKVFDSVGEARDYIASKRGGVGFLPNKKYTDCARCKKKFVKHSYQQKFCTTKCRSDFHNEKISDAIYAYRHGNLKEILDHYSTCPIANKAKQENPNA